MSDLNDADGDVQDGGQAPVLRVVVALLVTLGLLWVVLIGGFVVWLWWPTMAGS